MGGHANTTPSGQTEGEIHANCWLPNVIGCIDGTHIRIQAPSTNEHEYVNRKNVHSINVQVKCVVYYSHVHCHSPKMNKSTRKTTLYIETKLIIINIVCHCNQNMNIINTRNIILHAMFICSNMNYAG